ncbi:MAG: hypothetical protein Ta2B_21370 [Termitinemataceae bacterium]|nr:MAG: hypothetical protein Ta2B_21370 [Termitinemataceae bacterium]
MIKYVLSSPQVIGIAIVVVIYWAMVSSVANPKKRVKIPKGEKRIKPPKPVPTDEVPKDVDAGDLSLE